MTKTPEGDPVASQEWPPKWCVVCDLVPCIPHVRDDGHTCEVPMRVNPSLSRAKIKRIRARFDAMRGKVVAAGASMSSEPEKLTTGTQNPICGSNHCRDVDPNHGHDAP